MAHKKRIQPDDEGNGPEEAGQAQKGEQANDIESITKSLEETKEQAERYLANWQRSEADFINYKKRNEKERAELASFAKAGLMTDLLPVLDDIERALDSASEGADLDTWVEGVKLIYRKIKTVLTDHGLAEIEAEGEVFDPNFHEAVMCVEGEEGKVCEEIQRGYKLHDRLLRPSIVAVGKEAEGTDSPED